MSDEEQERIGRCILNAEGGIDWGSGPSFIALHCPFGAGHSLSLYLRWDDVPDWWPCTCGAEHYKHPHPDKAQS
jgi:hypothetical protein